MAELAFILAILAIIANVIAYILIWRQGQAMKRTVNRAKKVIWKQRDRILERIEDLVSKEALRKTKGETEELIIAMLQTFEVRIREVVEKKLSLDRKKYEVFLETMETQVSEMDKTVHPQVAAEVKGFMRFLKRAFGRHPRKLLNGEEKNEGKGIGEFPESV